MTIIAGSNGCGKSTLSGSLREQFQQAPILDPDAIKKSLRSLLPDHSSEIEAGRRVLFLAQDLIERQRSFTVETTLSGNTYLRMAARAKAEGLRVSVVLIGTSSVEINIARVKARVEKGGHDIAEADQRRRWPRTLANMAKLLALADDAVILDNSSEAGYAIVGFGRRGDMSWNEPVPAWAASLRG